MECSICYETFMKPNSREHYTELKDEFMKQNPNETHFFSLLLLLHNQKPKHQCSNEKCSVYTCDYCYEKSIRDNDLLIRCHFCRLYDYKTYMQEYVLQELQIQVLGEDHFNQLFLDEVMRLWNK